MYVLYRIASLLPMTVIDLEGHFSYFYISRFKISLKIASLRYAYRRIKIAKLTV